MMGESSGQNVDVTLLIDGNAISISVDPETASKLQEDNQFLQQFGKNLKISSSNLKTEDSTSNTELSAEGSSTVEVMAFENQSLRLTQDGISSTSDMADDIETEDKLSLGHHVCDICNKEFATSTTLNRHLRNIHKEVTYSGVINKVTCALCDYRCVRHSTYCCHLEQNHNINIEYEYLIFKTEEEFFSWKSDEEKASKASFTKKCNKKSSNGWETQYFYCHRSGYINTKKARYRAMKAQGSCKMNKTCPAKISVITYPEFGNQSFVEVEYVKTHVGHSMDLSHIRLNAKDKLNIALKLLQGTSFDQLLDSIHDSLDGSVERIHLITRKDIHNIASQYKINKKNDQVMIGIDLWVKETMEKESHNPILLYKPVGSCNSNYPMLQKDDFALVIMTSAQMHMLKMYGGDIIILDSMDDTSIYDFPLTTVMIVDELRQAYPVAFIIYNNKNENTLVSLFESIKNEVGPIKPQIFMPGVCELFHNAWQKTMGKVNKLLFCVWDVYRDWRTNLCLIEHKELQEEVYKVLKILLEETNEITFRKILSEFVGSWLSCETTKQFGEYFLHIYCSTVSHWACCYRSDCNVSNIDLEVYHKVLTDICDDKKEIPLTVLIQNLMKYAQDKENERSSISHKEKILEKLTEVRLNHEQSIKMDFSKIILKEDEGKTLYLVSTASGEVFEVRSVNIMQCPCALVCIPCNICIHKYACSCPDYRFHWNICCHIHLVCRKQLCEPYAKCEAVCTVKNGEDQHQSLKEICNMKDDDEHSEELSNEHFSKSTFILEKKKIKDLIQRLLKRIDTCNSTAEMNIIKQLIAPIAPK